MASSTRLDYPATLRQVWVREQLRHSDDWESVVSAHEQISIREWAAQALDAFLSQEHNKTNRSHRHQAARDKELVSALMKHLSQNPNAGRNPVDELPSEMDAYFNV